jgi:hypothetical protein
LDRKHSKVSKTVKMMSVSTIWKAKPRGQTIQDFYFGVAVFSMSFICGSRFLRHLLSLVFLNQMRQINGHFGDITTEFMNKRTIYDVYEILECQQKKIFKGKA